MHWKPRLALHSWTLDTTLLPDVLAVARQAGYDAVELRWIDFQRCFERAMANAAVLDLIRGGGVPVGVMGVEYGWMFATDAESRRLFEVFRRVCENAAALGCGMLMSAPNALAGSLRDAVANVRRAGDLAAEHGLRLALEFGSQHAVVNSLAVQREILADAGRPNCGLLLDAYHLELSGAGGRGFEMVAPEEIFVVQFSDVPARPVAGAVLPTDRLPPGRGIVRWADMLGLLAEKDYRGYLSYEAPNPGHWARAPLEVAIEGITAIRKLLQP